MLARVYVLTVVCSALLVVEVFCDRCLPVASRVTVHHSRLARGLLGFGLLLRLGLWWFLVT